MSRRTQLVRKVKKIESPLTRKQRAVRALMLQPWPTDKTQQWSRVGMAQPSIFSHVMVRQADGRTFKRVPRSEFYPDE